MLERELSPLRFLLEKTFFTEKRVEINIEDSAKKKEQESAQKVISFYRY